MKQNDHLVVAETFYSIQGEGQTVGIPAVFLRLGGCNLLCEGAGWRCDTIEVWQKGKSLLFEDVLDARFIMELRAGAHLIITGGEPLLQQDAIARFIKWLEDEYALVPTIEIETNGTIKPIDWLLERVDYWNCSPKLSNSGETYSRRVNEVAIECIKIEGKTHIFKFVIKNEGDILEYYNDYDSLMEGANVMLMPAGATIEELTITQPIVAEICKRTGFRYSPRLHVNIWNKKTGV